MTLNDQLSKKLLGLQGFYVKHGYYPSFAELQSIWKIRSKNAVSEAVAKLEDEGYIKRSFKGAIIHCRNPLPILGSVQAGVPTDAEDGDIAELDTIDDYLIRRRDRAFLLRVEGESMTGVGLHPGDIVVLERGEQARPGMIVVARVGTQWTIKTLRKRSDGRLELAPANPRFRPIPVTQDTEISGVVVGSFRRYGRSHGA